MAGIPKTLGIPFSRREGGLPPSVNDLSGWYFSKGLTADGLEVINSKGTNAKVVQRLCAEGDGATGYIDCGSAVVSSTEKLRLSLNFKENAGQSSGTILAAQDGVARGFMVALNGTSDVNRVVRVQIGYGPTAPSSRYSVDFTTKIPSSTWYNLDLKIEGNSVANKLLLTLTLNGVSETAEISGTYAVYGMSNELRFFRSGLGGGYFSGFISDGKLWHNNIGGADNPKVDISFEGSVYDTSGNNYHGIINGDVDLTATTINTDGIYSPNLNEGFDLYFDTATGLIPKYVPYRNGVPVVASVAGYTKDSEHPQETVKINNLADVYFDLGLDKSDVTKFNATCRASIHYNASHPTFWHASELTPTVMQSYLELAGTQHNTLFSGTTPNEYLYLDGVPQYDDVNGEAFTFDEDETNIRDILVYKTSRTKSEILRIMKYFKKEVGL